MLQTEIKVGRLTFIQVNIFGCYLPSHASIESVLDQIHDIRIKRKICDLSNSWVIRYGEMYNLPIDLQYAYVCNVKFKVEHTDAERLCNLYKQSSIIMAYQCELAGYKFNELAQNDFTVSWFERLVGTFNHDVQKYRKISGCMLKCVRDNSKSFEKYVALKLEHPNQRLIKHPEYMKSKTVAESFNNRIHEVARYDKRMLYLLHNDIQIMHKAFGMIEKSNDKDYTIPCVKCHAPFTSKQMSSSKICDSCQKKLNKRKKVSRRIDRKGWVFDRCGICDGGCGSPRIRINKSKSCLSCYLSIL